MNFEERLAKTQAKMEELKARINESLDASKADREGKRSETLDKIKAIGYKYSTIAGMTVSISDMTVPATKNELLDQAVVSYVSGSYAVRKAVMTALKKYIAGNEQHAFMLCRVVEPLKASSNEQAKSLVEWVTQEVSLNFS